MLAEDVVFCEDIENQSATLIVEHKDFPLKAKESVLGAPIESKSL